MSNDRSSTERARSVFTAEDCRRRLGLREKERERKRKMTLLRQLGGAGRKSGSRSVLRNKRRVNGMEGLDLDRSFLAR